MNYIELKKQISGLEKLVENDIKPSNCLLCGCKQSSFCNSHIVPQFILKEIAKEGMVTYGYALDKKKYFREAITGVKNAFTFRLICNKCDQTRFSNYENCESILNFEKFDLKKQNAILSEIAIKTHLQHIYQKEQRYFRSLRILMGLYPNQDVHQKMKFPPDIKEHYEYISNLESDNGSESKFLVLYSKLLDYKTDIATQTLISYVFDIKGVRLYNPYDYSINKKIKYFYLVIFPYKDKTRILFYIEKENVKYINTESIIAQFNELTEEEKLHFLFISLITLEESFYINPSSKMLKDKSIIKLYSTTSGENLWFFSYGSCKKIKKFRKYKNYLLENNNINSDDMKKV